MAIAEYPFELSERDVQIWTLRIGASDTVAGRFEPLLAADEKERAARFRFDHLRHSFVITRGVLRWLLGKYLRLDPAAIRFQYGPKGKPALASGGDVEFNATHSGGVAAYAFTRGCPLGIDVEQVRPLTDAEQIAERFFCADEAAEILSLPPLERESAFFRCWTRKEAYIKAIGDGLSAPLDDFRVSVMAAEPARFVHISGDTDAEKRWTLHGLSLVPGYAAALAYQDRPRGMRVFPMVDAAELGE